MSDRTHESRNAGRRLAGGALFAYAALLAFLRPAAPFEWDEVLYQRALDHYDVAEHSPHPPGEPAYIAVGKAVRWVVGDPHLALQLVAIAAALGALVLAYRLARSLGASTGGAWAAVCILGAVPGFVFHANIGLTDVPAAAALAGAVLACVAAITDRRSLPLAAAVVSLALSVRPQIVLSLLPVGLAALIAAARRRQWRQIGGAALAGVGVALLIWVPAILVTGVARYRQAIIDHAQYVAGVEATTRMPVIPWRDASAHWFVDSLGSGFTAAFFWSLVVIGAVVWWLTGRRWLVALAGVSGAVYLGVAMFSMNLLLAARYSLPAMTLFSLLAAGVVATPWRPVRAIGVVLVGVWCASALAWGFPTYLQRRETAPVWSALTWIKEHRDPARTTVVIDGAYTPHAQYVLKRAGFVLEERKPGEIYSAARRPGGDVVIASAFPVPGCEVLFQRFWTPEPLGQLTYHRYGSCAVSRAPDDARPGFSADWQVERKGWVIWSAGTIRIPAGAEATVARLCAVTVPVIVGRERRPPLWIEAGACRDVIVPARAESTIEVAVPSGGHAVLKPVEFTRVGADAAREAEAVEAGRSVPFPPGQVFVIPTAASKSGASGSFWRTDVTLDNQGFQPTKVLLAVLFSGLDNRIALATTASLAAGDHLVLNDVLGRAEFRGEGAESSGALLIAPQTGFALPVEGRGVTINARTYNVKARPTRDAGGGRVPAVPLGAGVAPGGSGVITGIDGRPPGRVNVGAVVLGDAAAEVVFEARSRSGARIGEVRFPVPAFGHNQRHFPLAAGDVTMTVRVVADAPTTRAYVYVSSIDGTTGQASYLIPANGATGPGAADRPPLPAIVLVAPPVPSAGGGKQ